MSALMSAHALHALPAVFGNAVTRNASQPNARPPISARARVARALAALAIVAGVFVLSDKTLTFDTPDATQGCHAIGSARAAVPVYPVDMETRDGFPTAAPAGWIVCDSTGQWFSAGSRSPF